MNQDKQQLAHWFSNANILTLKLDFFKIYKFL